MSVLQETVALRRELSALAARPEWSLLVRHDLLRKPPLSISERLTRYARRFLAAVGLTPPHVSSYLWSVTLKHAPAPAGARPLLIWAVGVERDGLRQACQGFSGRLRADSRLAPVLVTDVADFAYFSRLGWLVEYLPELSGEGVPYRQRKCRYLAWRYRDALILPISAGLASQSAWDELMELGVR